MVVTGLAAAAVFTGYAAGHLRVRGWPGIPPRDSTHIVFWIALAGVPLAYLHMLASRRLQVLLLMLAGAGASALLLQRHATMVAGHVALGTATAAVLFAFASTGTISAFRLGFRNSALLPLGFAMVATILGLIAGRSAVLGQLATCASLAFAPVGLVLSRKRYDWEGWEAAIAPCVLLLNTLLLAGSSFAMLPCAAACMIAAAPAAAHLLRLPILPRRAGCFLAAGVAFSLCASALFVTLMELPLLAPGEI